MFCHLSGITDTWDQLFCHMKDKLKENLKDPALMQISVAVKQTQGK